MRTIGLRVAVAAAFSIAAIPAQGAAPRILADPAPPSAAMRQFVGVGAPVVALRHVRLIDGTGRAAVADRTILIRDGRIAAIGGPRLAVPADATVLDLAGRSVMPGIVGMHDHMFYIDRRTWMPTATPTIRARSSRR
ncbi:hypothetical protein SLE2022_405900 [Rubroshorea leprosula]